MTKQPHLTARAFESARQEQAELHGRTITEFDKAVGNAVLRATTLAMNDVVEDNTEKTFRVVSAPTGSGKSCSAAAVIRSLQMTADFSCAYVVETIRQVDETGALIAELVGPDHVTVWSSGHDLGLTEEEIEDVEAEHGRLVMPRSRKADLKKSRIIVATHALWKSEMAKGIEGGVRFFNGKRRSVVFVDEHPALVKLIERTPGDLLKLRDHLLTVLPEDPRVEVLELITDRADEVFKSEGATYAPLDLVQWDESLYFRTAADLERTLVGTNGITMADIEATCAFITAAAKGCVFLSRKGPLLVAYETEYEPGPGHVLLDATADITGMTALMDGMDQVDVPTVDFSNLQIVHVEQPKRFKYMNDVVNKVRTAKPYAEWIKKTTLDHTKPGDDVLVVTHKAMLDRGYLESSEDPDHPLDWEGRKVNTIHFGIGIGSNKYKNKPVVCQFGEFYQPRKVAVSEVHGWTGKTPTSETLKDANRPLKPSGDVLTAWEGHLLRWNKQLPCRGAVRNIDADGRCGRMKLVTSMDLKRLMEHAETMFPGAQKPTLVKQRGSEGGQKGTKVDALVRLLASTKRDTWWSNEIEAKVGLKSHQLQKVIGESNLLQSTMNHYGWTVVSAKDLGQKGKRKALHRAA